MRLLLGCAGALALLLLALWWTLTQPFARRLPPLGVRREVDPGRLQASVEKLVASFAPRDASHPRVLAAAADWIAAELAATGARLEDQRYRAGGAEYRNVIARYGPAPHGEDARVIVGAHYDVAGELPGADDNASGVAGLLELARLLALTDPALFARPVELVAFTLEEPPFFQTGEMGSQIHASALRNAGMPVKAMIGLEMIGYFDEKPGSQAYPSAVLSLLYPTRGDFIGVVGRIGDFALVREVKRAMAGASPLPVHSIDAPRVIPGIDLSDHASYWDQGYPAVMISDTAFYRNLAYHTAQDLPGRLDYRRMGQVVAGVYQAVLRLSSE